MSIHLFQTFFPFRLSPAADPRMLLNLNGLPPKIDPVDDSCHVSMVKTPRWRTVIFSWMKIKRITTMKNVQIHKTYFSNFLDLPLSSRYFVKQLPQQGFSEWGPQQSSISRSVSKELQGGQAQMKTLLHGGRPREVKWGFPDLSVSSVQSTSIRSTSPGGPHLRGRVLASLMLNSLPRGVASLACLVAILKNRFVQIE